MKQLNIIGENVNYFDKDGKINGMLPILNKCITKIGKRSMNDKLLNPLCNSKQLERQYSDIDYISKKYNFDEPLSMIKDIEKIMTKIKAQTRFTKRYIFYTRICVGSQQHSKSN